MKNFSHALCGIARDQTLGTGEYLSEFENILGCQ
jgi:hypothetical protein